MSGTSNPSDWALLGLRPGATDTEVRDAYRDLAKRFHPDRRPGDVDAVKEFQRISDAYAALRRRRVRAVPPPAGAGRRPVPGTPTRRVSELAVGAGLWVSPAAVLVAGDRTAVLHRQAVGTPFPSASNTVRVELRRDGHHVFMPPQPSVLWQVGLGTDDQVLPVAALWVGDRQEDRGAPAPRMPRRLLGNTIGEMKPGDIGWAAADALATDGERRWWLEAAEPLSEAASTATPLRVLRDAAGWWAQSERPASSWAPRDGPDRASRIALVGVLLAGVESRQGGAPAER